MTSGWYARPEARERARRALALSAAALRDAAACDVTPNLDERSVADGLLVITDRLHDACAQVLMTLALEEDEQPEARGRHASAGEQLMELERALVELRITCQRREGPPPDPFPVVGAAWDVPALLVGCAVAADEFAAAAQMTPAGEAMRYGLGVWATLSHLADALEALARAGHVALPALQDSLEVATAGRPCSALRD